jgi:hypothetical protein
MFLFAALTAFIISSCEKEKAPEVDPNTLPMANFFYEIQYFTHTDANTYAKVTATNKSAFSNRWKWKRPDCNEIMSGEREFMTDKDSTVTQYYLSTNQEHKFTITLIAYSDVVVSVDSTITFESHPFVREITVKNP